MSIKYRDHRGGLRASMETVQEFPDRQALIAYLRSKYGPEVTDNAVTVEKYGRGIDARVGWDTHLVLVSGRPVGMTDGPV